MSLAWWNGRLVDPGEIRIDPEDAGLCHGDGLFETLRADNRRVRDLPAHLDRLFEGLDRIGLELPDGRARIEQAVLSVAEEAPVPVARLRVTVSRGAPGGPATRVMMSRPYTPPSEDDYRRGVDLVVDREIRLPTRGPLVGLKSLAYQANRLALSRAQQAGAFEALLLNEKERLVEGSRSNLLVARDDLVFTPPLADGCLPGTVRRRLVEAGIAGERSLDPGDLLAAGEVMLTSSLIGVLPVRRVEGRPIPLGPVAPRLRTLIESF
jgi:branched-chain amino acid aminotransferase